LKQTDHGISKIGGLKNEMISLIEQHPTFVLAHNSKRKKKKKRKAKRKKKGKTSTTWHRFPKLL